MATFHSFEPQHGHGLRYDPFGGIVAPRPIGWISTISPEGVRNLAPYSFFNAFNYDPPIIGFSSVGRKDTLTNIEASGEFVWNLATMALAEQVNASSAAVGSDVDEISMTGLGIVPADLVRPVRVAESPASFECRCSDIVRLKAAAGTPIDSWLVIGEVVKVHIDTALIVDDIFDIVRTEPLLRGGGSDYFTVDAAKRFTMRRPKVDKPA